MENYKKEYLKKRTAMIEEFDRLGRNFLKWLKKNSIDFDDEDSYELRINLGLLAGDYLVIYLNPESGSITISAYIPFDRVYDEYCLENGIAWKDFNPQKLTDDERKKIDDEYNGYVQQLVNEIGTDATMQKIVAYFKKNKVVVKIRVDPTDGDSVTIYESKQKETAKVVDRIRFLLGKI
ncbi:unnamed protein product, partial [marine sediment metagenome]